MFTSNGSRSEKKKKMDPVASAEATGDGTENNSREPTSLEDTVISARASASRKVKSRKTSFRRLTSNSFRVLSNDVYSST